MHRRQLITGLVVGVGIGVVGTLVTQWTTEALARAQLKHMLLSASSLSLHPDDTTIARLRAILPALIATHDQAVTDYGANPVVGFIPTEAFNRRNSSWHAILIAAKMTHDGPGLGYIDSFAESSRALPEEVNDAKVLREAMVDR